LVKTYRTLQQWNHWLTEFLGATILNAEKKLLARLYAESYGKYAVLLGLPHQSPLLQSSLMSCHVMISPLINKHTSTQNIESDFYELPLLPGSIDLLILPHTLEFVDNPHKLLLEACRAVKPEGNIIILGFNPFSLCGLRKYFTHKKNAGVPWNSHFISATQVITWLKLAAFQINHKQTFFFQPPFSQKKIFKKLGFIEWIGHKFFPLLGGIYTLTAKAKVTPLTPIKLNWKQKVSTVSATLPGPIMRDRQ
jgi:SAM-dependent methyltransferase